MSSITTRVLYDLIARDNASRTFLRVGESAAGLERKTAGLGAAISKGLKVGTLAVGALAAVSVHTATEFQSSMTKISTQAGGSAKDVKVLSDQVLKLGGKVQQAPQELADSLYHLKSVGMDNVSAMKALREASDLAAVGGANLEETTNALAGAWRTGIKGAGSFHEAVSTVNAIIGAGNMSMEAFNAAIGTGILPSAKTFGLSLKQVGAALALMTDEGIDSASAATRLRMSFSLLGAPSRAAEKQLKKIGLTGLDLANAMRGKDGIIGAIQLLKDHLDASGMSAAEESQLLSRAFGGGKSSSGILLLINNLDVLKKKQDQINHSTGKFDEAVKQQRKTAEAEWKRLETGLESLSVRLGVVLLPPFTNFVGFLNDKAIPAVEKFSSKMAGLIPVGKIKTAVGEVKTVVGGLLSQLTGKNGIGGFLQGLTGSEPKKPKSPLDKFPTTVLGRGTGAPHLGSGQTSSKGSGAALAPMPHYGVGQVAPVNGVTGAPLAPQPHGGSGLVEPPLEHPTRSSATPKTMAMPHGGSALTAPLVKAAEAPPKSAAQKFGEMIRKAVSGGIENVDWSKLGKNLGEGLGKAIAWVAGHGADLSKKLGAAVAAVDWVDIGKQLGKVALPTAIGIVDNLFDPLFHVDFWKKHWLDTILAVISVVPVGKVGGVFAKLGGKIPWGGLGEGLSKIKWSELIPFASKISEATGPTIRAAKQWVGKVASGFGDAISGRFPRISQRFEDELTLLPVRLEDLKRTFVRKGHELIDNFGKSLLDHIPGSGNKFIRATLKIFGRFTLYQVGINLAKSLLSGIWAQAKNFGSWVQSHIVDPVVHWVKSGFGIASPSKVFTGIGHDLMTGLKNGIYSIAKSIGGWISAHVVSPVTSRFSGSGSWLVSKGKSLVSGFKSGVYSIGKSIGSWTSSHVISPVTSRFHSAGSWLHSAGSSLVSGLKSGIGSAMKGIGGWLKSVIVDPIVHAVKHYFGIKSPSRVFMGIGGHLVTGLVKGMSRTSGTAIAHKIFGSMPKALAGIVKKGLVSVASLPSKALSSLGKLGGGILGMLGLGGSGSGSSKNQSIGQLLAAARGWSGPQWAALRALWTGESGWNERALNKSSGAYGIPQSLPASKMASAGADWRTNAATQIKWGLGYIASRYGNPMAAYSAWLSRSPHWYAKGTRGAKKGLAWVGEQGAELVNFGGGEDVLSHQDSIAYAKAHGIRLPGYASGTVKTSIANEIATGLQKTLATATASAIASAIKGLASKLLSGHYRWTAGYVQKEGSKLEALASKKASIESQISAANQYAADQTSNITDFLKISGTSAASVRDLITQMTSQQKTATSFVSLSKTLKAKGASKGLLQALSDAGPGSQLATILGAKGVTTADISKLNKLMASGSSLASSFGKSMADLMYDSGKDAGRGFLAGLKGQEADLTKQMAKLASSLVKEIKKVLKIHSPSAVMRDEVGKQVALGMVAGMDAHRPHVAAAARRLADTAYGASTARSSTARVDAAFDRLARLLGSGQLGGTEVHVHFDDPTLKDLIRTTTKPMIKANSAEQAQRAKVGRRTP